MDDKWVRLQNGMVLKCTPLRSGSSCIASSTCSSPSSARSSAVTVAASKEPVVNINENAKEDWTEESTRALLDLYYDSLPKVGPLKVFKSKKHMWEYIATEIANITGVTKTWEQCNTRYKTVLRRKTRISFHNKCTGVSPAKSEYVAEFDKIASIDDSLMPEVLMSGSKEIVNNKTNDIESRKRKTKSDTLLQIHMEREANKKKRHEEKMDFINTLKNDLLKVFENKK